MATYTVADRRVYFDKYDLTADHNSINLIAECDMQPDTTFTDTWRSFKAGLINTQITGTGYYQSDGTDAVDDVLWGNFASNDKVMTVCPTDGTDGEVAYITQGCNMNYVVGETIGNMLPFSFGAYSKSVAVRGKVLERASITATGNGSSYQEGAISATQYGYAALHVVTVSGTNPTLDLIIQSDDNTNFTSATTRITFTQAAAATSEWKTVAGAVTDDYWRAYYTIGGTDTPTFSIIVSFGIM